MRTLSSTLTAAQKSLRISPLYRIVLTKSGQTTKTYTISRLRRSKHIEKQYSQIAEVVLDNSDSEFTSLDLMGYKGVISYGATTSAGDEYSATAPLWVVAQDLSFAPGFLPCYLSLIGTPNRLDQDKASTFFFPTSLDTKTVKTLLKEIARGGFADWAASTAYASGDCVVPTANNALIYRCTTAGTSAAGEPTWGTTIGGTTADNTVTWTCKGKEMTCYRHTTAYTITFDSDDSLIDAFIPADAFRINLNGTRLDAMRRLIAFTKCQMRVEDDEEIHVYQPTTTGTTYNYEYKLNVADEHNFIAKGLRRRIVVPNYIQVDSHPDTGESYTGYATDSAAIEMRQYWYLRPVSNAQATSLAEAILEHYKLDAEQGSATIPILNCGQEVLDYIKITGPTEVGDRVGNVEYINRTVDFTKAGQFLMTLSYGDMPDEPHKLIGSIEQREEDRTIDSLHYDDTSITTAKIKALAITTAKLAAEAVTANEIGALAVTTAKLAAGAVTTTKLAAGAVTANEITALTITANEISALAITTAKINDQAVTNIKVGTAYAAGDSLLHSNDTSVTVTATSYTKYKEIYIPFAGTLRVKFDMMSDDGSTGYARIYRNGVAKGTEQSTPSDSVWYTKSEDLSGWVIDDLLQLYANSVNQHSHVRNLRLYCATSGLLLPLNTQES